MSEPIKTKTCFKCKQAKPTSEFYKCSNHTDGLGSNCKECDKQIANNYRRIHHTECLKTENQYNQTHRLYRQEYASQYRKTIQGHLRSIWYQMLRRCRNPQHQRFKDYGARGIHVNFACFEDFYQYVKELMRQQGFDPRTLTIDRIDNNGHYEPGNIQFVTMAENCHNRRPRKKDQLSYPSTVILNVVTEPLTDVVSHCK